MRFEMKAICLPRGHLCSLFYGENDLPKALAGSGRIKQQHPLWTPLWLSQPGEQRHLVREARGAGRHVTVLRNCPPPRQGTV